MNELERALVADSAAAPPDRILEGLNEDSVHRLVPGAPHTIYQELWHIAFWLQVSLNWIAGVETPFPAHASAGFLSGEGTIRESWNALCSRFFEQLQQAVAIAGDAARLETSIRCSSQPGHATRTMSVREQLESLAAHNAYHLGRIVLLRQISGAWPPASGGFSW